MFNSLLIEQYGRELQSAIRERHKEIVEFRYDLWMDLEKYEENAFEDCFQSFFPPGFIERDKERAKRIIRDLYDIIQSPAIRHNPDAIYCYVMHQMIEAWFDDEYTQTLDLVPDDVKAFAAKIAEKELYCEEGAEDKNASEQPEDSIADDPTDAELIIAWFTDKDSCVGDFEDTYDQDYSDESWAEEVAEIYLEKGHVPAHFGVDIRELIDLLPNDLYYKVTERLEKEDRKRIFESDQYVDTIWPRMESCFLTLSHGDSSCVSSYQGAMDILLIFRDWVINNGGWRDVQNAGSIIREDAVRRMIFLGAKTYLENQNLDYSCDNNIGIGQEDIKISRGNDKTIIEIKLTSNPTCKHGFEKQLPRYAEAEHTDNMVFCLIDLGNQEVVDEIYEMQKIGIEEGKVVPKIIVVDARTQKSASVK